jgi:hypothetical protein
MRAVTFRLNFHYSNELVAKMPPARVGGKLATEASLQEHYFCHSLRADLSIEQF